MKGALRPRLVCAVFVCGLGVACSKLGGFDSFSQGAALGAGGHAGVGGVLAGGSAGAGSSGIEGGKGGGTSSAGGAPNASGGVFASGGSTLGGAAGEPAGGDPNSSIGSGGTLPDPTSGGQGGVAGLPGGGQGGVAGRLGSAQGGAAGGLGGQGGTAGKSSGAAGNTTLITAPSCLGGGFGRSDCGPLHDEDCCATRSVPGGSFNRQNDRQMPATLSGQRLDRFEVTLGRFRAFVNAVVTQGYLPASGAGKHVLQGGRTLAMDGWDETWNAHLPSSLEEWSDVNHLRCPYSFFTEAAEASDARPVGCLDWYQAYAFCIWDGGYLPTFDEWNYAAVGGSRQFAWPWGAADVNPDLAVVAMGSDADLPLVGSKSPAGDGYFGQADMIGSVWEWMLSGTTWITPCLDCMGDFASGDHVGGSYVDPDSGVSDTHNVAPDERWVDLGMRCARPL
jgi:formylglycine-generating enzyme required for sulfatase activity